MVLFTLSILFFLGMAVGSFLHVVIYRTVNKEDYISGRSHCPYCNTKIAWYDNIPLVSFLVLRGRCRHCRKKISWSHPLIELMTGTLFVWWYFIGFAFFRLGTQPFAVLQPAFWLIVGICLIIVLFADLLYGIIPDLAVAILTFMGVVYRVSLLLFGVMRAQDFWITLVVSLVVTGGFWALWYGTKKRGLGLGDVKLIFPLSLVMGWPEILVGLMTSFVSGSVVGLALIAVQRHRVFGAGAKAPSGSKRTRSSKTSTKVLSLKSMHSIPFGPFLVFGTVVALLFGERLVSWYITLLR